MAKQPTNLVKHLTLIHARIIALLALTGNKGMSIDELAEALQLRCWEYPEASIRTALYQIAHWDRWGTVLKTKPDATLLDLDGQAKARYSILPTAICAEPSMAVLLKMLSENSPISLRTLVSDYYDAIRKIVDTPPLSTGLFLHHPPEDLLTKLQSLASMKYVTTQNQTMPRRLHAEEDRILVEHFALDKYELAERADLEQVLIGVWTDPEHLVKLFFPPSRTDSSPARS